ncbi:energy-coupling factor ABC transporter substrate-binding protein [Corynebacterium pseudopelargi]|uniref:Cobalt transport protein CbiN n=1 Tax=Corynebacterium pseudopelargi TaxID=2080757 RepID=A0A3G6IZY5_9CORY|nr:energy-coupling factor ABC transporter substrate-binding protein [Corynebacterium pseudopelargi]AZA09640.1 Cobalt transport protein CbiN [Corynebacterium pseudopelargi]
MKKIPTWALLILAFMLVSAPMLINTGADVEEPFAGTDSTAETLVEETNPGYEAWFSPLVGELPGEVESGLFAFQAAMGAGLLGYVFGSYRERSRREAKLRHPGSSNSSQSA